LIIDYHSWLTCYLSRAGQKHAFAFHTQEPHRHTSVHYKLHMRSEIPIMMMLLFECVRVKMLF